MKTLTKKLLFIFGFIILQGFCQQSLQAVAPKKSRLVVKVVDADTGKPIPSRLYLKGENDTWHFFESAPNGNAVIYSRTRAKEPESSEYHTSVSSHGGQVDLLPGKYELTVERGKEYFSFSQPVEINDKKQKVTVALKRWINANQRGWYSGDTHVHRPLAELPTAMLAEELNVCLPLTYWVTEAYEKPEDSPHNLEGANTNEKIQIDKTHVIYPRNTEYEIFRIGKLEHELGALFLLNHKTVFQKGVPPIGPIVKQARAEGALLELDKHNWPWSMAIAASHNVDLYELTNNHLWRSKFSIKDFGESPSASMKVERDANGGFTERGWIDFGFENYYALLNCGLRMRPTGGTANGVHPVPLGFGRVYVHLPNGFSYEKWIKGLNAGRSFVTTGPMLFATINEKDFGHTFKAKSTDKISYSLNAKVIADSPVERFEVIVNGKVVKEVLPANVRTARDAFVCKLNLDLKITQSSWVCVRVYQKVGKNRWRFAHSAPFHIEIDGKLVTPRLADAKYLVQRVQSQIDRSKNVLPPEAIAEYKKALDYYQACLKRAK